jgi:hypothetical protein
VFEPGPDGPTQGFEPVWQTCPTAGLPFGTPFTDHETAKSDVLVKLASNVLRWLTGNVADDGDTVTLMLLTSVTAADA